MQFNYNATLYALSYALDCVEHDLIGVTTNHGKRIAALSVLLGQAYGLSPLELQGLAACAVLHDCALTEYVQEEYHGEFLPALTALPAHMGQHCRSGERCTQMLPFGPIVRGAVLYHHENADGTGPLGKTAGETPLPARIIHIADTADAMMDLSWVDTRKQTWLHQWLGEKSGTLFDADLAARFGKITDGLAWSMLRNEKIDLTLHRLLPGTQMECTPAQLMDFAAVFAAITDYKSHFTRSHSMGIADKALHMARCYGADEALAAQLYFAGALHDIGKLVVDRDVLEKPARLTDAEYRHIQTHAYYTYQILSAIPGLEDVTRWASRHHEKLDGSGYPFGLTGNQLDRWDRLLACLDIYQALTEDRSYKRSMTHGDAVCILRQLAAAGKLDAGICEDIAVQFAPAAAPLPA